MISHIRGNILAVTDRYAIIEAGSIGYKVFATADTLGVLQTSKEASLFTYLAVREDALDLYGFQNEDDLGFFELLITVSGIGPKSALGILGITSADDLRRAIATGLG
jgi:Holliday junction DNA helicase RuvA